MRESRAMQQNLESDVPEILQPLGNSCFPYAVYASLQPRNVMSKFETQTLAAGNPEFACGMQTVTSTTRLSLPTP